MENNPIRNTEEKDEIRNAKFSQSFWAYTLLSWLAATVPALLVIPKVYGGSPTIDETTTRNVQIIVIGLCSFFGATGGLFIGLLFALAGRKERILAMFLAPLFGGIWGIGIGAIGGFPIFFIGGIILGWMFAVPLGVVGFTLFAVIYEAVAARFRVRWWQIILIEIGVLSLSLGGVYYLFRLNYPYYVKTKDGVFSARPDEIRVSFCYSEQVKLKTCVVCRQPFLADKEICPKCPPPYVWNQKSRLGTGCFIALALSPLVVIFLLWFFVFAATFLR